MSTNSALVLLPAALPPSLLGAIETWAIATTDADSARRRDLLRDKGRAVADFFAFVDKPADAVTPYDVSGWRAHLEAQGLKPATVYAKLSRVSSFYRWAMKHGRLTTNPVEPARPKAPRPYGSDSAQSLADDDVRAILAVVKARGDVVGNRDYALLLFYFFTGMRRAEVLGLRWGDVRIKDVVYLKGKVKGGEYREREVRHSGARDALLDYLRVSGRMDTLTPDSPLWTRHDRAGKPGAPLSGHALAKNFKRYARAAGVGDVHLHQTRHTFARMVSEDTGSIVETQHALGHKREATTRVYVQRVGVMRDTYSEAIGARLGVE